MGKPSAVPLGAQRKVEKPPVQCCSHLATVCVHALITGAGVSTPTSRRKPSRAWVEENFAVTFASTKILVQTQWEAVRFDRVKHTAGTLVEVLSASAREGGGSRGARAAGAISLCGAITLRAAVD